VRQILRDAARTEVPNADDINTVGFGTWMAEQFAGLG
jgi:hypothetical protein